MAISLMILKLCGEDKKMKAININDRSSPFTDWILDGKKTIETREKKAAERGEASEEAIYEMEDVIDGLDTAIETINDNINV